MFVVGVFGVFSFSFLFSLLLRFRVSCCGTLFLNFGGSRFMRGREITVGR